MEHEGQDLDLLFEALMEVERAERLLGEGINRLLNAILYLKNAGERVLLVKADATYHRLVKVKRGVERLEREVSERRTEKMGGIRRRSKREV